MPFRNSVSLSRRDIVKIAQRFNAGLRKDGKRVPEGRHKSEIKTQFSVVPPGLWGAPNTRPSVETLGYCRMSLRDRLQPEVSKSIRAEKLRAHPYQTDGSFIVDTLKLDWTDATRDRVVPVKIYFPKSAEGPLPVIIFSHGLGGSRDGYGYLGRRWASHGYVAVHLQHAGSDADVWEGQPIAERVKLLKQAAFVPKNTTDRPKDVSFAIDELTKLNGKQSPLRHRLNLGQIGVAGHSFGAFTALATAGQVLITPLRQEISFLDPRVKAVVAMSASVPENKEKWDKAFGLIKVPCLHMTGTLDDSPIGEMNPADRRVPFDRIKAPHQFLVTFAGGDHFIFSGRWRGQTGGRHDKTFQDYILSSSTAFWDAFLKEDRAALKWLNENFTSELGDKGVFERK